MQKNYVRIGIIILFFVLSGSFYFLQQKKHVEQEELPSSIFSQMEQEVVKQEEVLQEENTEKKDLFQEEIKEYIFVYVCGAVQKEGVYKLQKDDRLYMAIELAGGFTEEAAKEYHNLARTVKDGERIYILTKEEVSELSKKEQIEGELEYKAEIKETNPLVNLNTASLEELMTLSGIGEAKAKSIIEYRTKVGKFQSIDELMNISGIGEAMFAKVKSRITIE